MNAPGEVGQLKNLNYLAIPSINSYAFFSRLPNFPRGRDAPVTPRSKPNHEPL